MAMARRIYCGVIQPRERTTYIRWTPGRSSRQRATCEPCRWATGWCKASSEDMTMSSRLWKWGLTIALAQACAAGLLCSESWAWQTNVKGTANDNDEARAVAVDSAGNLVAAGFT